MGVGQRLQVAENRMHGQKMWFWCAWGFFMALLLFPSWEGYERMGGVVLQCHLPLCVCVRTGPLTAQAGPQGDLETPQLMSCN